MGCSACNYGTCNGNCDTDNDNLYPQGGTGM